MRKTALIASLAATVSLASVLEAKTIKIGIGHQVCAPIHILPALSSRN